MPEHPEALPELPEAAPLRGGPLSLFAALLLHGALLAGITAGVDGGGRTYQDGGISVSLVAGEGGGAPAEAAKEAGKETPRPSPLLKKKASAEIPAPVRKTPRRPAPAAASLSAPEEETAASAQAQDQDQSAGGGEGKVKGAAGAGGSGGPGGAYALGEVDRRPVLLRGERPEYPTLARRQNIQGGVTVRMRIDERGVPGAISILNAAPDGAFEKSVLETLPAWRYRPALKDGRPVPVWVVLPLRFALH